MKTKLFIVSIFLLLVSPITNSMEKPQKEAASKNLMKSINSTMVNLFISILLVKIVTKQSFSLTINLRDMQNILMLRNLASQIKVE
jgi:hypothetical protein